MAENLHRDQHGRLTRAGMEHAIAAGGSVIWNGEIVTDLSKLPDEAELAKGDEVRAEQVRRGLDDQIAVLAAQRARLDAPAPKKVEQLLPDPDKQAPRSTAVHVEAGKVEPHEQQSPHAGKGPPGKGR